MDEKLVLLLGLGIAGLFITSDCFKNSEVNDYFNNEYYEDNHSNQPKTIQQENYTQASGCPCAIQYSQNNTSTTSSVIPTTTNGKDVSPLNFSDMAGEASQVPVSEGFDNGTKQQSKLDQVYGLPVTNMTDLSAGEHNKYIYDRTINAIGWTSTKIGGNSRGQADYIRGDLPIIPDRNGWFQVSADPSNKLLQGAMNVANGISTQTVPSSTVQLIGSGGITSSGSGAAHALRQSGGLGTRTLDDLIDQKEHIETLTRNARKASRSGNKGAAHALQQIPKLPTLTVEDIQRLDLNSKMSNNINSLSGM